MAKRKKTPRSQPTSPSPSPVSDLLVDWVSFPVDRFMSETWLSRLEVEAGITAQTKALKALHGGLAPYARVQVSYSAPVFGATTPYGIVLGDSAFPVVNYGHPRWEVMAHEQGHNFFGAQYPFYGALCFPDPSRPNQPGPNPFLQEALAVFSAFYAMDYIRRNRYTVSDATLSSMEWDFANGRAYQQRKFDDYVAAGCLFNFYAIQTSQVLDVVMIQLGEQFGFSRYTGIGRFFSAPFIDGLTFWTDGASPVEQSTFIAAVLHHLFPEAGVAQRWAALKFPLDATLFDSLT